MIGVEDMVNSTAEQAGSEFDQAGYQKKSLAQGAYDKLLDLIITRKILPGTVVQERMLSSMLDISRTPAREALYRLESDGFLTRISNRIVTVREISLRDIIEILHIRKLLEVESVSLAVGRIPLEELDMCEQAIRNLLALSDPSVSEDWEVDDHFHSMVARYSGNDHILKMVMDLRMKTRIFNIKRVPERYVKGHEEHLVMIEAFRRGDGDRAKQQMHDHLENVRESIIRKLSEI